jgi:hypothetical protein
VEVKQQAEGFAEDMRRMHEAVDAAVSDRASLERRAQQLQVCESVELLCHRLVVSQNTVVPCLGAPSWACYHLPEESRVGVCC